MLFLVCDWFLKYIVADHGIEMAGEARVRTPGISNVDMCHAMGTQVLDASRAIFAASCGETYSELALAPREHRQSRYIQMISERHRSKGFFDAHHRMLIIVPLKPKHFG